MADADMVVVPTIVIGVGALAGRVLERLERHGNVFAGDRVRYERVKAAGEIPATSERVDRHIAELFRTSLGRSGHNRLDLLLIGDAAESGALVCMLEIIGRCAELIAEKYSTLFPAEPGAASIAALVATPTLTPGHEPARTLARAMLALDDWQRRLGAGSRLGRVFLLHRQHEHGVLHDEDAAEALFLFALAGWFMGLRNSDTVVDRAARASETGRWLSAFSTAAVGVDVDRVLDYCAGRTALQGLDTLWAQANPSVTERWGQGSAPLPFENCLDEFERTASDEALGTSSLPPSRTRADDGRRDPLPAWLTRREIRERASAAIEAWQESSRPSSEAEAARLSDTALARLDRREWEERERAAEELSRHVADALDPRSGLRSFTPLLQGLSDAIDRLERDARPRESSGEAPPGAAEALSREAESAAWAGRLRRVTDETAPTSETVVLGSILGAVAGEAALGLWTLFASRAHPTSTARVAGTPMMLTSTAESVAVFAVSFALVAAIWVGWRLRSHRRRLAETVEEAAAAARSAHQSRFAARHLQWLARAAVSERRRRLARALGSEARRWRLRLEAVQAALREARQTVHGRLSDMGARISSRGDVDPSDVLGHETPVHRQLVRATTLDALWNSSRASVEPEIWAGRLLEAAWPAAGIEQDSPFGDAAEWFDHACKGQHEALRRESVFEWHACDEEVRRHLGEFIHGLPETLGLGMCPLDEGGQPLPAVREVRLVAPEVARRIIDSVIQGEGLGSGCEVVYSTARASRVIAILTHSGFTAEQLRRWLEPPSSP